MRNFRIKSAKNEPHAARDPELEKGRPREDTQFESDASKAQFPS